MREAAHSEHPIHAPLDDRSVGELINHLHIRPGDRIVDLGCGTGEWLLRIAQATGAAGVGIDTSRPALRLARARAAELAQGHTFIEIDASAWHPTEPFHKALCAGATHAFGGLKGTLRRVHEILAPGGTLLVGEGFWQSPPTAAALKALGTTADELADLDGVLTTFKEYGYQVVHHTVSSVKEWSDYESAWVDGVESWAIDNPKHADAAFYRKTAAQHREAYFNGYRGVLGFVTAVLVAAD